MPDRIYIYKQRQIMILLLELQKKPIEALLIYNESFLEK
jgi:hypothetical protein